MTTTNCDTERCEVCQQDTVAGNDELGRCSSCSQTSTLDTLLRSMAAGVTRDRHTGRFTRIKETNR